MMTRVVNMSSHPMSQQPGAVQEMTGKTLKIIGTIQEGMAGPKSAVMALVVWL